MKRIAAVMATAVALLGIPATAMASTGSAGEHLSQSRGCMSGKVAFVMPPNGYFFTEYSGPELYVGEQFSYGGTTYTIATASGAVFSLVQSGSRYQNGGLSVPDGTGTVSCAGISAGS